MLKISRRADYALLLLTTLSQLGKEEVVSLREISKQRKMPFNYLSQIAPILVEAGILGSKEGTGGGYYLLKETKNIHVVEVIELFDGPIAPVACMRSECACEPQCVQKSVLIRVAESFRESIGKYSLFDLIREGK